MKNAKLKLAALSLAAVAIFAFTNIRTGVIKGMVTPADGAVNAWAVSATDTLKATVDKGTFSIADAKPGTYRVIIEAKPPYKNAAKDGVTVTDGQTTDVGEIKLEQ